MTVFRQLPHLDGVVAVLGDRCAVEVWRKLSNECMSARLHVSRCLVLTILNVKCMMCAL